MAESGLLHLPLEILHLVIDLLDLASTYQLGAACRDLHRLIHQVCIFNYISGLFPSLEVLPPLQKYL